MLIAALTALVATATISLILPIAVRLVVDNFNVSEDGLLAGYFVAAIGIAGLLAVGTALRYYLVTRLGERVVADIRKAVFDRMIGMSPAFFERIMTGEVLSRITTDTTLILSVIGSSVSIALRNLLMLVGGIALMLWTSVKMSLLVLWPIPVIILPIIILGRRVRSLSRENQDWIAMSRAMPRRRCSRCRRCRPTPMRPPRATPSTDVTEKVFRRRQEPDRHPGGDDVHRHHARVLGHRRVLWDRRARRAGGR